MKMLINALGAKVFFPQVFYRHLQTVGKLLFQFGQSQFPNAYCILTFVRIK